MFLNNTKFFDHMKKKVSEDISHVMCAFCHMVCTSVSLLKAHIRFQHCDECPFHCHLWDSSFKNAYDLHKHVETHNDSDAYSCDVEGCGFTSQTLQTLRRPYKRVHVPSVTPTAFLSKSNSVLKYKCHICQKCFSWSYTLTLHLQKPHELSSHSHFGFKEDDERHLSLNLAGHNAVTDLGQAPNNKMVTNKSSPSSNNFGREGGDSCKGDTSTAEVHFTQHQPWSQATGENGRNRDFCARACVFSTLNYRTAV
nr:histone H4 transcription factor-like isoform X2 [Columba livia]XP_021138243.1 histone H4 transcription factor-like isoform X2 [Columba livia]XP_021138244.1 histone H4 transcription factor-like isoform X2 [Columba livia]XP_021138245.1 histone H4 transcription factor-like isoform X2 [Columba livia]XP_021138246.1 histone H4 transcription factor-like isoform X2 [Columba livia]